MTVSDLGAWLEGEWVVNRTINADDTFEGVATFSPAGNGCVRWHERGQLVLGGHSGEATRELTLVPGDPWQVVFDDGRPFHPLDLETGHWHARHDCGADVYRGEFTVRDTAAFVVTWRVEGPGRDDTISTVYTRR